MKLHSFVLFCLHLQSDVSMGHLSADYSVLHINRSLVWSLPYTSGLGQALAGQHTMGAGFKKQKL